MPQTPHTIVTNAESDDIGQHRYVDGDCYIKTTSKTSTTNTRTTGKDVPVCAGTNVIDASNIDISGTSLYCGFGKQVTARPLATGKIEYPQSDSLEMMVNPELNPFWEKQDNAWLWKYSATADRSKFPWIRAYRPVHGFYFQMLFKFKQPIDIPPGARAYMMFEKRNAHMNFGGVWGPTLSTSGMNVSKNRFTCTSGGFYTTSSTDNLALKSVSWSGCQCCPINYFKAPADCSSQLSNGVSQVTMMTSSSLYVGCRNSKWGGAALPPSQYRQKFNGVDILSGEPVQYRILGLLVTGGGRPLVEGVDFHVA